MNDAMRRLEVLVGEWDLDTEMRADASEDAGRTWRKDLDYIFERRRDPR